MQFATRLPLFALSLTSLLAVASAQRLQLATSNVAPDPHSNWMWYYNGSVFVPPGPVTFPSHWMANLVGYLDLAATPTSVSTTTEAMSGNSLSALNGTEIDLVTTATMPFPARVEIQVQAQLNYTQALTLSLPIYDCGVDLGADGIDEFSNVSPNSATATLTTWCDSIGTAVRWHQHVQGYYTGGILRTVANLSLQFDDPVQELAYGPTCEGSLGCQLGTGQFDRIFVASLPANTSFAWLMGGDTPWNVTFPGFTCPLLVDPQFILAVPLQNGPNGRKYVDFAGTFPPIPGLSFYAQGIAISGGTFIGTNGVRVRT